MKNFYILIISIVLVYFSSCVNTSEQDFSEEKTQKAAKEILKLSTENSFFKISSSQTDLTVDQDIPFLNQSFDTSFLIQEKENNFQKSLEKTIKISSEKAKELILINIENLQIEDSYQLIKGENILYPEGNKDSSALSHYLEFKMRQKLYEQLKPTVEKNLTKDLGLGFSCVEAYNDLVKSANSFQTQNFSLPEYTTNKILDLFFISMGQEEKFIRKQPYLSSNDLIIKALILSDE